MTRPGRSAGWWCERRAAVSILFATMIIPLIMLVGIAIDYTNYNQILSQLSLAADAGAIHAVRVAENQFVVTGNAANAIAAGNRAAAQWYAAELYNFSGNASVTPATANVQYDRDTHSFTETVTYGGTYRTAFGRLFQVATWNIGGSSSASVTTNSYVEVAMLIDNSSSMQIGAGPADIQTIEGWTLCPPAAAAAAEKQPMSAYSWNWPHLTATTARRRTTRCRHRACPRRPPAARAMPPSPALPRSAPILLR